MRSEELGVIKKERIYMKTSEIKPAEGKLGVLVVGLGAVSSTFMTGVLMARKGLTKPVGSMVEYDKVRVKGACSAGSREQVAGSR